MASYVELHTNCFWMNDEIGYVTSGATVTYTNAEIPAVFHERMAMLRAAAVDVTHSGQAYTKFASIQGYGELRVYPLDDDGVYTHDDTFWIPALNKELTWASEEA